MQTVYARAHERFGENRSADGAHVHGRRSDLRTRVIVGVLIEGEIVEIVDFSDDPDYWAVIDEDPG